MGQNTIDDQQGNEGGGIWGFLSDLVNAGAAVATNVFRPSGQAPQTYTQQSGFDPQLMKYGAIALMALVAYKIIKG